MFTKRSINFKNIIHMAFSALFAFFLIHMAFGLYGGHREFSPNLAVIAVLAIFLSGIGFAILYALKKLTGLKGTIIRAFLLLLCFSVQFYLFWKTSITPGWDANIIVRSAIDGFLDMMYYSKLPNNLFPAVLMRAWVTALNFLTFIYPLKRLIILNILLVDGGLFFTYLSTRRVFGCTAAERAMLIAIPLLGFSPWVGTPYTDTMAIFFTSLILYSIIRAAQAEKTREKQLFLALAGFGTLFGMYIKVTVVIIIIAVCLAVLTSKKLRCMFNFKLNFRQNSVLALATGLLLAYGVVTAALYPYNMRIKNEHPNEVPRTLLYYLDHGIRSRNTGAWSGDNYEWTAYNINKPNYEEMALQRIWQLVESYGASGMAEHLYNKLLWAGTDGTFAYGMEGAFYTEPQDDTSTLRGFLQNYLYIDSYFYQNVLSQFLQALWYIVCALCAASFFYKDDSEFSFVAKLAVGGIFVYLMLFENRSRYIFLYTPVIIFCAQYKAESIIKAVSGIFKTKEEESEKPKEKVVAHAGG